MGQPRQQLRVWPESPLEKRTKSVSRGRSIRLGVANHPQSPCRPAETSRGPPARLAVVACCARPEYQSLHHDVFQFVVQKFFRRALPRRVHFHEVGQHALRTELPALPVFQRGQQLLRRFGCIGMMRKNVLERFPLRPQPRSIRRAADRSRRVESLSRCAFSAEVLFGARRSA